MKATAFPPALSLRARLTVAPIGVPSRHKDGTGISGGRAHDSQTSVTPQSPDPTVAVAVAQSPPCPR